MAAVKKPISQSPIAGSHRITRAWVAGALAAVVPIVLIVFSPSGSAQSTSSAQSIKAVQVHGAWEVTFNGPMACDSCSEFPLTLGLWVPDEVVPLGAATSIDVSFTNRVSGVVTLRKPVYLHVRIASVPLGGQRPVIWEGALPPLVGSISPGAVSLRFEWDQRDSSGRPAPRGKYVAAIVFPVTIAYKMDGNSAEEKVKTSTGHAQAGENDSTHFEIR
jgi:hypothetical protein